MREEVDTEKFRENFKEKVDAFLKYLETSTDKKLLVWKQMNVHHHMMLFKTQIYKGGFD